MPSKTLWEMKEQTVAKHLVLKSYLNGWFPILGSWNGRLLFIDGFAGPGEYEDGEPGSPLIALECVRRHKEQGRRILRNVEVVFLLIEEDTARAKHLESLLRQKQLPSHTRYDVRRGTFEDHMNDLLDYIDEQNDKLAPSFVMIDPFGVKGCGMNLFGRILQNDQSECMISFMYEPIRRFREQPELKLHLNELFGTYKWQRCAHMTDENDRKFYLHDLFKNQLKKHGAKQVVFFELWNGNRHVYTIYFASGNRRGCDLMKQSIWKADRSGNFRLTRYAGRQELLLKTDTEPLAQQLRDQFGDRLTPVEQVEEFVMSDKTMFHTGQLRRDTLQRLEKEKRIAVIRPQGARGFTSGKGIKIRFH